MNLSFENQFSCWKSHICEEKTCHQNISEKAKTSNAAEYINTSNFMSLLLKQIHLSLQKVALSNP